MSLMERKSSFDNISRVLAITRFEIEQHQAICDYSLNIHGENFYRDVINYLFEARYENTNFKTKNAPSVDLVDEARKKAIQITTTTTPTKVDNTLKILKNDIYKNYDVYLFYLLNKPNFNKSTIDDIERRYTVKLNETLYDSGDLLRMVNNLPNEKIIELDQKYFVTISKKYTDKIVLDLVIKHLIKNKQSVVQNYDDDFGSLESNEKLALNKISPRIAAKINEGLDYKVILKKMNKEDNAIEQLRNLIINDYYRICLIDAMKSNLKTSELDSMTTREMHDIGCKSNIDFNKVIVNLEKQIEADIEIKDFNTMEICWIIISFFFELCDIGMH